MKRQLFKNSFQNSQLFAPYSDKQTYKSKSSVLSEFIYQPSIRPRNKVEFIKSRVDHFGLASIIT